METDSHDGRVADYQGYVAVPTANEPSGPSRRSDSWDRLPASYLLDATRARLDRCKKTTSVVRLLQKIQALAVLPPGTVGADLTTQAIGYREAAAACLVLAEACEREGHR